MVSYSYLYNPNLANDNSFENTSSNAWVGAASSPSVSQRSSSYSHTGSYSWELFAYQQEDVSEGTYAIVYQNISDTDINITTIKAWFYLNQSITELHIALYIRVLNTTGDLVYSKSIEDNLTLNSWVNLTVYPNVLGNQIRFSAFTADVPLNPPERGIQVFIDDVEVYSEPTEQSGSYTTNPTTYYYLSKVKYKYSVAVDFPEGSSNREINFTYPKLLNVINITNSTGSLVSLTPTTYNSTHNLLHFNDTVIESYGSNYTVWLEGNNTVRDLQVYPSSESSGYYKYFSPGSNVIVKAKLEDDNGNPLSNYNVTLNLKLASPTKVKDLSGNGNHGTIYGAKVVASPYDDGKALSFDGVDDYVEISRPATGDEVSVEVLIKYPSSYDPGGIFGAFLDWTPNKASYLLWSDKSNMFSWRIQGVSSVSPRLDFPYSADNLDKWYHVFATYSKSEGKMRLYINASLYAEGNFNESIAYPDIPWYVGRYTTAYTKVFIALIHIYNRSLTESEIKQNYYSVVYHNVSYVTDGLVLYFEFDSFLSPTECKDLSGNGNDGVAYNGVERILTEYGWALKFDGVDDHIEVSDSPTLRNAGGSARSMEVVFELIEAKPDGYPILAGILGTNNTFRGS